ncbi:10246_t:CDS:1, partial [Racocetra fulgida]
RCAKDHEWQARFSCIKIRKRWCLHCAGNAPHTIEEARQIAHSKN